MNKQEFASEIIKLFPNTTTKDFEKIEIYKTFLQEYNLNVNLTRLDKEELIYGQYFYESVVVFKDLDFKKINTMLDIGSGSGIPGVVLKILFDNLKLTIIESNNKKITFLKLLVNRLDLKDVTIIYKRAEEITEDEREKFDLVTSRAVATISQILEVSAPYCKVNGYVIEPKSLNYEKEKYDLPNINKKLGLKLLEIKNFVSVNKQTHNVFIFRKNRKTNPDYPRLWKEILASPI